MAYIGMCRWTGYAFDLSVLNRVYDFVRVRPNYKHDENCLYFKYTTFAAIHPTFKHAPRKESTIKRSLDDLELFDDQRRKSVRII